MQDIKKLKTKVYLMLEQYPKTRNSDTSLTNVIWLTYYKEYIKIVDGEAYINIKDLYKLPTQDDIKRIRAEIQNKQYKFLPTSWEVAKQRKWQEQEYRKAFGYNPELRTV